MHDNRSNISLAYHSNAVFTLTLTFDTHTLARRASARRARAENVHTIKTREAEQDDSVAFQT